MATKVISYEHICPQCGRVFQRGSALGRHIRSVHTKERSYACQFCPQRYARIDLLQRHVSLYHKHMTAQKQRMQNSIHAGQSSSSSSSHAILPPADLDLHRMASDPSQAANDALLSQQLYTFPQMMEDGAGSDMEVMNTHELDMSAAAWPSNFDMMGNARQTSQAPWPLSGQIQSNVSTPSSSCHGGMELDGFGIPLYPASSCSSSDADGPSGRQSSLSIVAPSVSSTAGSDGRAPSPSSMLHPLMNFAAPLPDFDSCSFVTPYSSLPNSVTNSMPNSRRGSAIDGATIPMLTAPFFEDQQAARWLNLAEHQHNVHLFRQNLALHLPFIHMPTLDMHEMTNDELDDDLRRAMGIVGYLYGSNEDQDPSSVSSSSRSRECSSLKSKMIRSIEEIQEHVHHGAAQHHPSKRLLLRRTQTMVLLQLSSIFGHTRTKNDLSIKLSHGSLIVIARALLQEFENEKHNVCPPSSTWYGWVQHEEIVRTLWIVYIVDSMLSLCHGTHPWLSLSELSGIPDFGCEVMWAAQNEVSFNEALMKRRSTEPTNHPADLVKSLKSRSSISFPRAFSLAGNLIVLISLVAEIIAMAQVDHLERKRLAVQLEHAKSMSSVLSHDIFKTIEQSVHKINASLRQDVDDVGRRLTQWLSLLHVSTPYGKTKGIQTPFLYDFMPWYWTGTHTLGLLNKRVQWTSTSGSSSNSFPFPLRPSFGQMLRKKSAESTECKLNNHLMPFAQASGDDSSTAETTDVGWLTLLVGIRHALNSLDGGASMQATIGDEKIVDFLPSVSTSQTWIINLFPAFS